jgi:phytoene dehydrogenase-like protein
MGQSLRDWVDAHISQEGVKELLMSIFRIATYTNAPDLMSAGTALEQLKLAFTKNVLYLDGGWQTLVDGLAEAASGSGVTIETGARAERVERGPSGAVRAVRLAGGRVFAASTVVIASSPAVAARMVEGAETTALARWASRAIPVKAACLDVALDHLPRPKATFAAGIDGPFYLSVHSAAARLAPEGGALIHAAKYLSPDHGDSQEPVERELESLLDLVQPGWREAVVHRRFLPDMIVMNALPTAEAGGARGRPGPRVEDVPGLFVAGDWVGCEGLLADASLASAREAARLVSAQQPGSLAVAV